ncbi:MAG TPA: hypothetical protein VGP04_11220, partial [Pseudonocardiaceae bacterium]|nr:hypothetical protein [Pseudonocardiaceae bacterium]
MSDLLPASVEQCASLQAAAEDRLELLTRALTICRTLAFSPDGRLLATGSDDKSARLWNVTDPNHPAPIGLPITGHQGPLWSVA